MISIKKFSAKWCSPCRMMQAEIRLLRKLHPTWKFEEIDIDKEEATTEQNNIHSVPTLIFTDGKKTKRLTGFRTANDIEAFVYKHFGGVK